MGNISHVSSKKTLNFDGVTAQILEINERRFGSFFEVVPFGDGAGWGFFDKGTQEEVLWFFWLSDTKRKISGKHPRPNFEWIYWAWSVFQNELGDAWGGSIGDEGMPKCWKPDRHKYVNMREWFQDRPPKYSTGLLDRFRQQVPERLRDIAFPPDMQISRTKLPFQFDVKRFNIPFVIQIRCPKCNFVNDFNYHSDYYLSNPPEGVPFDFPFYCDNCDHNWTKKVTLRVTLEES